MQCVVCMATCKRIECRFVVRIDRRPVMLVDMAGQLRIVSRSFGHLHALRCLIVHRLALTRLRLHNVWRRRRAPALAITRNEQKQCYDLEGQQGQRKEVRRWNKIKTLASSRRMRKTKYSPRQRRRTVCRPSCVFARRILNDISVASDRYSPILLIWHTHTSIVIWLYSIIHNRTLNVSVVCELILQAFRCVKSTLCTSGYSNPGHYPPDRIPPLIDSVISSNRGQ